MSRFPGQVDVFPPLTGTSTPDAHGDTVSGLFRALLASAITALERAIGIVPEDWPADLATYVDAGHNADGSVKDSTTRLLCEPPAGAGEADPQGFPIRYGVANGHGADQGTYGAKNWSVSIPGQDDGGPAHRTVPLVFAQLYFDVPPDLSTLAFGYAEDCLAIVDSDSSDSSFSASFVGGASASNVEAGSLGWTTISRE